jgi:hypothetical protein
MLSAAEYFGSHFTLSGRSGIVAPRFPISEGTSAARSRLVKIDGHCHCGQITFEAEVDPDAVAICHCTDCQMLTGSAFRANVSAPADKFWLLSGAPNTYIKTAESGNKRRHAFCGNCGTHIYTTALDNPKNYSLRIGTITQRAAFHPQRQIWRRSALSWVDALGAIPASEKG